MKVLIEESLMHVCRLLRMLNIKCMVFSSFLSSSMYSKNAVVVTKSARIMKKARQYGMKVVYVKTTNKYEILRELIKQGIKIDLTNKRKYCSICGGDLDTQGNIFVCTKCGKRYWYGSHWENLKKKLKEERIIL